MTTSDPVAARFWSKVDASGDCWLWTGARHSAGYGNFTIRHGRSAYAHRFAYETLVGPIPDRATLDHLCRIRLCVNPDHLEPVSNRENILRGYSPAARHARATHCRNGHALVEGNLYRRMTGQRICRTCDRARYSPERRHARWVTEKAARAAA